MTTLATKLYATQNNSGSPSALVSDIVALASTSGTPATTTTLGVVKQAAHIANTAVPFPDLTTAANAYNALLAALQAAGQMA